MNISRYLFSGGASVALCLAFVACGDDVSSPNSLNYEQPGSLSRRSIRPCSAKTFMREAAPNVLFLCRKTRSPQMNLTHNLHARWQRNTPTGLTKTNTLFGPVVAEGHTGISTCI